MKIRPIPFMPEMVRKVKSGQKTITRRIVRPQPKYALGWGKHSTYEYRNGFYALDMYNGNSNILAKCPYGQVGDKLWVKETWKPKVAHSCGEYECDCDTVIVEYLADKTSKRFYGGDIPESWRIPKTALKNNFVPSMFMPRWASRLLLEITDVRIERIQSISEEDALAEGCVQDPCDHARQTCEDIGCYGPTAKGDFKYLWDTTYGKSSWNDNIWVWVIEFKVIEGDDQ